MKKNLLLSSLLLGSVCIPTGCVEKDFTPKSNNSPIKSSTPIPIIIHTEPVVNETPVSVIKAPVQTEGDTYDFKSIQGEKVIVKINKTGFEFPQYAGKIVLLQFFGKKCQYCFKEMPIINKLRQKYGNKLQVIAIQSEEVMSPEEASAIIETHKMDYPIIEKEEAMDLLVFLRDKYEWLGTLPYLLLIKDNFMQSTGNSYEILTENIDDL